ncbi:MAG: uroporphyrinogen-III synthase [Oscillochloridaceae bacterium]|nr:uroporphyrinogen-III synthase [Chloroflexaceae bacterium]MDW8389746.1 uroporphyrinogen-III synthase [Oscillochloridaceae bacterium]
MAHSLRPSEALPLFGRRILLTAPRTYAPRFAAAILDQGGLPVLMPTIETTLLDDYTALDACLRQRKTFDWIAFTSRNGIEALLYRCEQLGLSTTALNACRLAAIGKDAERLAELGLRVDLTPREPSPRGIVTALAALDTIQGAAILVPAPLVEGVPEPDVIPTFVADLQRCGMRATRVPAYRTRALDRARYAPELALMRQGAIDAIAFSSAAEIAAFLTMVNTPQDYGHCAICCFGPYTAQYARQMGLSPDVIAEDFSSFDGFATAIARHFTGAKPAHSG